MTVPFPRIGRRTRLFLALGALLVVTVAAFDWNWFRYPLQQYLVHRSHRDVRVGHLDVDVGLSLEPTVHLRDVYVQNAPWGSERPTAVIGAVSFTFSLRSVWEARPVISRLVLHDAEVSLERQADGLRNWRLRRPDDRGPGRLKVLRLEPHGVIIHLARRDIDLDVTVSTGSRSGGAEALVSDASHPLSIVFDGRYGMAKFAGAATTSREITLIETDEAFPIRAWMTSDKMRLDFVGTLADLYRPSSIDGDARLNGPSFAQIGPFFKATLPASRDFEIRGRFRSGGGTSSLAKLHGKIGGTAFDGNVDIDFAQDRPKVRATLHSSLAHADDFGFLMADQRRLSTPPKASPEPRSSAQGPGPDVHLSVTVEKLRSAAMPELESLRFTADLSDRVINVKPMDLGIGGGHVKGVAQVDLRPESPAVRATVDIEGVRVEQLLARLDFGAPVTGPLQGHFDLRGHGRSLAGLLGSVSGTVQISMDQGTISNRLDAKLGLNGGKLLRLMFTGDRAIGIRDAAVAVDFKNGVGQSTALVFDTDQTRTEGVGVVDMRTRIVDILLHPEPKKTALLALRSAIRVHGDLRRPAVSLVRRSDVRL